MLASNLTHGKLATFVELTADGRRVFYLVEHYLIIRAFPPRGSGLPAKLALDRIAPEYRLRRVWSPVFWSGVVFEIISLIVLADAGEISASPGVRLSAIACCMGGLLLMLARFKRIGCADFGAPRCYQLKIYYDNDEGEARTIAFSNCLTASIRRELSGCRDAGEQRSQQLSTDTEQNGTEMLGHMREARLAFRVVALLMSLFLGIGIVYLMHHDGFIRPWLLVGYCAFAWINFRIAFKGHI